MAAPLREVQKAQNPIRRADQKVEENRQQTSCHSPKLIAIEEPIHRMDPHSLATLGWDRNPNGLPDREAANQSPVQIQGTVQTQGPVQHRGIVLPGKHRQPDVPITSPRRHSQRIEPVIRPASWATLIRVQFDLGSATLPFTHWNDP